MNIRNPKQKGMIPGDVYSVIDGKIRCIGQMQGVGKPIMYFKWFRDRYKPVTPPKPQYMPSWDPSPYTKPPRRRYGYPLPKSNGKTVYKRAPKEYRHRYRQWQRAPKEWWY